MIYPNLTIVDLSHYALISVRGPDAQKFLQGQLTCDMRDITETHHNLGAYCNLKGRVIAIFRIFLKDNIYYLQLPKELVENTLKKLKKHAMFSKVTIEENTEWKKIGVAGKNAEKILSEIFNTPIVYENGKTTQQAALEVFKRQEHSTKDNVLSQNNIIILSFPVLPSSKIESKNLIDIGSEHSKGSENSISNGFARFELLGPSQMINSIWESLLQSKSEKVEIKKEEFWKLLDIEAEIPEIFKETTEIFLPHYINLPQLNAVSFTKGCYHGQEVIARMEYKANIKRHLYHIILPITDAPIPVNVSVRIPVCVPAPGALLFLKNNPESKDIGTVVMASQSAAGIEMLVEILDEYKDFDLNTKETV